MKKFLFFVVIPFLFPAFVYAQNIGIGTPTPRGKLHIKGNADTSQLVIDANSVQSNTRPLIRLRNASGVDLVHINSDNPVNTFVGLNAGRTNNAIGGAVSNTFIGALSGSSNTGGYSNTAIGRAALFSNAGGHDNTAIGAISLYYNITGSNNTAIGRGALYQNDSYDNTATGFRSLFSNTGGSYNTTNGSQSLVSNITGSQNTSMGYRSLGLNNGSENTAYGSQALYSNISGTGNVAVGARADANSNTSYNTIIGFYTYVSGSKSAAIGVNAYVNGNNSTAIGADATVNSDNKMQLGNTITSVIATAGGYVIASDARFKDNISNHTPGLAFITSLRPVSYNFNYKRFDDFLYKDRSKKNTEAVYEKQLFDKTSHREIGFIAQEVEKLCLDSSYTFNGVYKPQNAHDNYSLDYSKFVVPLVKAIQEQQSLIETLQRQVKANKAGMPMQTGKQQAIIMELTKQMAEVKSEMELLKKKN